MQARATPPSLTTSQIAHFWSHVQKTDTCWLWTGWCFSNGYGAWRTSSRAPKLLVHRVAYYLATGEWPPVLDHLCRVRNCVRLTHLEPVTHAENLHRGTPIWKQRREATHCKRGHAYAEHGYTYPSGYRGCKLCKNMTQRAKYHERNPDAPSRLGPQTHCKNGHPWTPENTYNNPKGYRVCRTCRGSLQQAWYAKPR